MQEQKLFEVTERQSQEKENKAQVIRDLFGANKMNAIQIEEQTGYKRSYINKITSGYAEWKLKKDSIARVKRATGLLVGEMVLLYGESVQFVRYSKSHAYFNLDSGRGKQANMKKEDFIAELIK